MLWNKEIRLLGNAQRSCVRVQLEDELHLIERVRNDFILDYAVFVYYSPEVYPHLNLVQVAQL